MASAAVRSSPRKGVENRIRDRNPVGDGKVAVDPIRSP